MLKKLLFLGLVLALVVTPLTLTSCGKDNPVQPVLTADQTNTQVDTTSGRIGKPGAELMGGTAADQYWWKNLSQADRNMAILYRAESYNNKYGYFNCKEWARTVVLEASRNVVRLPGTLPNENGWYFASSPYLIGMSGGIRGSSQGTVVQMNWRLNNGTITPHTMIVTARSSTGVYVIEANWSAGWVKYRWISFTEFDAHIVNYSCYTVTGG